MQKSNYVRIASQKRYMKMSSQKSISEADAGATQSPSPAEAKVPKRRRGHERVASLLQAAAEIFEEKGYDAATMTEIAARAGAPIGSLYQFFPNKDLVADALVARYGQKVTEGLAEVAARAPTLSAAALADSLLDILLRLSHERRIALRLLDMRWHQPGQRPGLFRHDLRRQLADLLGGWQPGLDAPQRAVAGIVLLQAMKSVVQLHDDHGMPLLDEAITVWRGIFAGYLATLAAEKDGLRDATGVEKGDAVE